MTPLSGERVHFAAGRHRPTVTCCVSFDKFPDALTDLATRRTIGRVVVDVRT